MPQAWEDRVSLYCTYLVEQGHQSGTIRSYKSAIKMVLMTDGFVRMKEKFYSQPLPGHVDLKMIESIPDY